MRAEERLEEALAAALRQSAEVMGQPVTAVPQSGWVPSEAFWSEIAPKGDGYLLEVTTGLADQTTRLMADTFADEDFQGGAGLPLEGAPEMLTHLSLVWLMLHELQHIELNHFDLSPHHRLTETRNAPGFGVAQRGAAGPAVLDALPREMRPKVPLCLEMQADHDACELLLDAYSSGEWMRLRQRAMAISAMMMLIEREDARNGDTGRTHPKAATRIFQLLGHIAEMPLIPAQVQARLRGASQVDPADLPSAEEQAAFNRQVIIPCFFDAVALARVAGAGSIRDDLGEPEAFFSDISAARLATPAGIAALRTAGAREWAQLLPVNAALKPLQTLPDGVN